MPCDGDTIRLAPAWPKDWNASSKLHAPKNTTVEGRVKNGKLADLKVTPASRLKDMVFEGEKKDIDKSTEIKLVAHFLRMKIKTARIENTEKTPFVFPVKSAAGNIPSPSMERILH